MRPRVLVLTALSLTIAGGAAVMTNNWLQQQQGRTTQAAAAPAPIEAPREPKILVADGALTAGTILKPDHLRWQAWPEDGVLDVYVVDTAARDAAAENGRDALIGAVVRASMVDGEPITDKRVVRPGDRGFLAAMLAPGHRALSVPVNAASGISGLIFPGDRVDVILSHSIKNDRDAGGRSERTASETVLSDIRVLALDQRTDGVDGERVVAKTATLEVAPKEAETLSLAQRLGDLSLSLRPLARNGDPEAPAGPTFTTATEISRVMSAPRNTRGPTVVVVRGSEMTGVEIGE
ncbi:Flp pilus assembly protein CpaB [Rhodovibrio sodomensis]|uniref:Flp pilus assembly protein CpaB n=1 Tax=Rhodovibrio sodomensis TaxID=1088 RepID=A0ABS1DA80_9PROT|nr:Flp pilus assembly protein CpaB [Rhodovibrio sodomensis]MBK1666801.1 Flp pilus assembly protein CpaB [Rhodovibrio sodomensis]